MAATGLKLSSFTYAFRAGRCDFYFCDCVTLLSELKFWHLWHSSDYVTLLSELRVWHSVWLLNLISRKSSLGWGELGLRILVLNSQPMRAGSARSLGGGDLSWWFLTSASAWAWQVIVTFSLLVFVGLLCVGLLSCGLRFF